MNRKTGTPAKKWYLSPRFLAFLAVIFVLGVILTRNIYEPLAGMLIFWATLILPAMAQQAWKRINHPRQDTPHPPGHL